MTLTYQREAGPAHYAQIQDPETFFRELGEQAAERIDQMQTQLAGPDPVGESYLEKVGRLRAARNQAEEYLGHELLSPPETEEDEENADPDLQQYLDWKRGSRTAAPAALRVPGKVPTSGLSVGPAIGGWPGPRWLGESRFPPGPVARSRRWPGLGIAAGPLRGWRRM
jgi:hypothetical protein